MKKTNVTAANVARGDATRRKERGTDRSVTKKFNSDLARRSSSPLLPDELSKAPTKILRPFKPQIVVDEHNDGDHDDDDSPTVNVNLSAICDAFSDTIKTRKTFKALARAEIDRDPTELDKIMSMSKVAAIGRRKFDKDEMAVEEEEEEEESLDDLETRVKAAKPKYMEVFKNKEEEEAKRGSAEAASALAGKDDTTKKMYGLWDSVNSVKALPTLMKVKREWVPPDWERTLQQLKAEGRDAASIDADLKEIRQEHEQGRTKTGKYLMPEDLIWCRKHTKFREKTLLRWFRRFRAASKNGEMTREEFLQVFKEAFPIADTEAVAEIVFEACDMEQLDFKDFIVALDAVNCKNPMEKLRWAARLWDRGRVGVVSLNGLGKILVLCTEVEEDGFINGATPDEVDELLSGAKREPHKPLRDRVREIANACGTNMDGNVELETLFKISAKLVYTRD